MVTKSLNHLEDAIEAIKRLATPASAPWVCYTSIMGDYDSLIEPQVERKDIEFVCFSDNKALDSKCWKIIPVDFKFRDPRRTAKLFKCLPSLLFPDHQQSTWVDGNIGISGEFFDFVEQHESAGLLCFKHHRRRCVYREARACLSKGKDDPSLIKRQIAAYRQVGMPKNFGLIHASVLHRDHNNRTVVELCESWLGEIDRHSVRDQLSLPFVIWRKGFRYGTFTTPSSSAPGLHFRPHSRWIFYDSNGRQLSTWRTKLWEIYYRIRTG